LAVEGYSAGVTALTWLVEDQGEPEDWASAPAALQRAAAALDAYFANPHRPLPCVPLLPPAGATPFQRRVWAALRRLPPGAPISYGELARRLGSAPRAVGAACRANPWPVLIPCHRVVASNGLGGYGGGGDAGRRRKRRLLEWEGWTVPT
jgi:methylated-DNA-[protein]-cysteine S-methyltransferase